MVAREDLKWKTLENRYYIEDKLRKMLQQEFPEMKEAQFELSSMDDKFYFLIPKDATLGDDKIKQCERSKSEVRKRPTLLGPRRDS